MRSRDRRYVDRVRAELFAQLGSRCVMCGSYEDLTFDHIRGRGPRGSARSMSQTMRAADYRRAASRGELQVLCRRCNSRRG